MDSTRCGIQWLGVVDAWASLQQGPDVTSVLAVVKAGHGIDILAFKNHMLVPNTCACLPCTMHAAPIFIPIL